MTTAQTIHALASIALKAHGTNASPVDIKIELAQLPLSQLMKIQEHSAEAVALENTTPHDNR